jgi:3-hydroxybutyrate dehydrogenase
MNLAGKVALVTGAASGIGKEIALTYAKAGAAVVIADLDKAAANAAAGEIERNGGKAFGVGVTDEAQVEASVAAAVKAFCNIDILVSNAGIQIVHPIEDFSFAEWKKCWRSTLTGLSSPPVPASGR